MDDTQGRRWTASLRAVGVGLILLTALWLLPDLTPTDAIPAVGQESLHGRIVETLEPDASGLPRHVVVILEGPEVGTRIEASMQAGGTALPGSDQSPTYGVGDEVVVARFTGPAGGSAVIAEPWRVPMLGIVALVFAAV